MAYYILIHTHTHRNSLKAEYVFLYVWSTHVFIGTTALAAGSCLSSPDQRSAAQLSHLVRHRICSVLQQWCEVQAPLTTPDPPAWAGVTGPGREMAADTGVMEPKGHEESHGDGENTSGVTEDNQKKRTTSAGLSHALMLRLSVFLTPDSLSLPPAPLPLFSGPHFLSSSARSTAPVASCAAVRSPLSLCDGGMACGLKGR